jgi:hypothetical protein
MGAWSMGRDVDPLLSLRGTRRGGPDAAGAVLVASAHVLALVSAEADGMSDDERLNLRDLPPVDVAPPRPARFSQTLLRHANNCKRAAYLYLRYGGGTPAVQLDFGTAAHAFFERALLELLERGESSLYAPQAGEDAEFAAREVASLTAAMVDELLRERPELTVPIAHPTHSQDHLREQAYHWAVACDIEPESVLAVERKFLLELPSGITISGKLDVAQSLGPDWAQVSDYKTTFAAESEGSFEDSFQGKLYALLLLFGTPVEKVPCPAGCGTRCPLVYDCEECAGSGFVERALPPMGEGINWVRVRELYPRLRPRDGRLREVAAVYSRQSLADWLPDVDRLAADLVERFESRRYPAVPGSHCSECPCQPECPLPAVLRRHAGTINSMGEAAEAAEKIETQDAEVKATKAELRRFGKAWGPIRYGADRVLEFQESESFDTDWPALEDGVVRAVEYGEPFELGSFRRRRVSSRFVARTLDPDELEPEESLDERFGSEAPF